MFEKLLTEHGIKKAFVVGLASGAIIVHGLDDADHTVMSVNVKNPHTHQEP